MFGKAVLVHAEILELTNGGVMHEGGGSRALGLRGMPAAAEEVMVYRDIALAELTGGRVHILHVSTAGSVDLIRRGRRRGVRVSGEACPHHFTLTDECLRGRDSNYKMAPPLRTQADVAAIIEGLKDGTLEVIATDHAPHAAGKEGPTVRPGAQRHHRPGDAAADLRHRPDRAGPPDLAAADREADDQPGPRAGHRPRHAAHRGRRRRDGHRPDGGVDHRPGAVPLEEPQLSVCRLEGARSGRGGDRGWRSQGPVAVCR